MAVVVNITEKARLRLSHVLVRGTNAGEPLMRPRNRSTGDIKTGALPLSGNKYGGNLITGHAVSGVKVAQWRDSSLGSDMELKNRVGGDKGKSTSGSPARPKLPIRQVGADRSAVVTKRGNARGAKGTGHSSHGQLVNW